jgi:hypothetical protein
VCQGLGQLWKDGWIRMIHLEHSMVDGLEVGLGVVHWMVWVCRDMMEVTSLDLAMFVWSCSWVQV